MSSVRSWLTGPWCHTLLVCPELRTEPSMYQTLSQLLGGSTDGTDWKHMKEDHLGRDPAAVCLFPISSAWSLGLHFVTCEPGLLPPASATWVRSETAAEKPIQVPAGKRPDPRVCLRRPEPPRPAGGVQPLLGTDQQVSCGCPRSVLCTPDIAGVGPWKRGSLFAHREVELIANCYLALALSSQPR